MDMCLIVADAAERGRGRPWGPGGDRGGAGDAEAEQGGWEEAHRPPPRDGVIRLQLMV